MHAVARILRALGAFFLAVAVGLDAWYAHGLVTQLDAEAYDSFGRALSQHYVIATGMLLAAWRWEAGGNRGHAVASVAMLFALFAFCGDVYLGALGSWHPGIAPKGGMAHILAWLVFAGAELRGPRQT